METVRSSCSRGNPAIGVEAHRALMIDILNPKALMLNIGCRQFQFDLYDMAIYIFSAIESVIRNRHPCLLAPSSFSMAQRSAGTVPWLPFRSDIIILWRIAIWKSMLHPFNLSPDRRDHRDFALSPRAAQKCHRNPRFQRNLAEILANKNTCIQLLRIQD